MRWNKKKEDRTPEDYQKKANEQIQKLKNQWKTFFRTGPIVIAAVIVMIALSIAWFVSNTMVDATGVQISAAGSEFDLAAAKADTIGHHQLSGERLADRFNPRTARGVRPFRHRGGDGGGKAAPRLVGR